MENPKSNNIKRNSIFAIFLFLILLLSGLSIFLNLSVNSSNDDIDKLNAEIDALRLSALELKERAERVTNNFASGGGTIVRIFETEDSSDVVVFEDFFTFDRYHLNYRSEKNSEKSFNWDTKNRGRVVFNNFKFNLVATTVDKYISKPFDINSNSITMTGLAEVRFVMNVNPYGELLPVSNTGDVSEQAEFEILKYKLVATDSGLGEANKFDNFDLTIMPNSVEAPNLYKVFGESETITGELKLSEITIERSER